MNYRIAIGSDHRGFQLKSYLLNENLSCEWLDCGTFSSERTDYPLFVLPVISALHAGTVDGGILICGTGVGMAIAANRHKGIYAGLVWNEEIARLAKEDDNINVLVLPADYMSDQTAVACISSWISAVFKKGRYQERLSLIDSL
ncbi:RpiB/LacA/LacB family sugar-phosphate isomerase [Candidatus Dependentiae bacterium]|nr:RpiB/LacA/LacB family sugar-phosphate isomerase [Candidatus Dependentiae bacterium]